MARTDPQVNIRMPVELKEKLEAATSESNRSLNGEIIARLEESFEPRAAAVEIGEKSMDEIEARMRRAIKNK
ncbi:Arc family DNA-binding protein [Paraburkholderia sp. FT54]|uniref:Arc family DNA-binding protein n=1 Tax=Paraburkholderia sp. FT54 TaxID=3074437 RepID=UPI002877FEF0|nr:Arc family DNA-binding protein [Paraburkholderia sp. FT54]WNC88802.1 Arc family DNA-binding protein [Paraburkholderia sp. FT54]